MRPGHRITAGLSLLSLLGLISCQGTRSLDMSNDRPYEYDTHVAQQLEELHKTGPQGAHRRLDELTDFPWDTVHLFGEGNTYQLIDDTVGSEVFGRDGRYLEQGSLLVFVDQGRVAQATALVPPIVSGRQHTYPRAKAVVKARTQNPGPYQLDLVEESG